MAKEFFSILFHRKIAARSGEEKNQTSPDWRTPLTDDDHVHDVTSLVLAVGSTSFAVWGVRMPCSLLLDTNMFHCLPSLLCA